MCTWVCACVCCVCGCHTNNNGFMQAYCACIQRMCLLFLSVIFSYVYAYIHVYIFGSILYGNAIFVLYFLPNLPHLLLLFCFYCSFSLYYSMFVSLLLFCWNVVAVFSTVADWIIRSLFLSHSPRYLLYSLGMVLWYRMLM